MATSISPSAPDRHTGEAVSATPLFDSAWVLWCAPSHPLARRRRAVRWAELAGVGDRVRGAGP
jgi:DNA-binding transcriptional LysR family regulator